MLIGPVGDVSAPLARRNPVAKLGAVFALTGILLFTLDPVTPAVALAVELAVVPFFGVRYRTLLRRGWPILLSAVGVAVVQLLFGTGPDVRLSALGLALRVFAVAVPSVLVFATIDPTDLADALVQQLRLPQRLAIGALAAVRMLPLLVDEWRMLGLARRARGIDAGRSPLAHLRLFASTLFALLVAAMRRGTRLAIAMDARGFDGTGPRTAARRQLFTAGDWALVLGAAVVAGAAMTAGALA